MIRNFLKMDKYIRIEKPQLTLCEVSKKRLCMLYPLDVILELKFADLSSIDFKIPKTINGELYKYYNDVVELRMIYLPNVGYFQIIDVTEESNGIDTFKTCKAYSAQVMFQSKRITGVVGEYKLWNPLEPHTSLMGILLTLAPSWKVGTVDGVFITRQRSVNITESDLYAMMTNNFYESFEAIFVFDYNKYEINIYDARKQFKNSQVFISSHNLLKSYQIESQSDKIVTALKVLGGDGLDISGVNPTGGTTLYNVDAFIEKMSTGLQTALQVYKTKYDSLKQQYSDLLVEYKNRNIDLNRLQNNSPAYNVDYNYNQDGTAKITPSLTIDSGLSQLEGLRTSFENIKAVRIQHGNIPYSDVNAMIPPVEVMITQKKVEISNAENVLNNLMSQISNITNQLKMENNFTDEQWIELNEYFRYDVVQNNAFIITDNMTQDQKQQIRQELLEYGELVLSKSCYPTYIFKLSTVNFLALPEFKKFQDEFELGTNFTLKINDYYAVKPMLLGVKINFNDLSDFELTFGNKTNINEGFDFSAYRNAINVGANLSFDLVKIEALKSQTNVISEFINGALNIVKNNLFANTDHVEIIIDENGMRFKQYEIDNDDPNVKILRPNELWINGTNIAFSNDNFTTCNLAVGEIEAPGSIGGRVSGVIADAIVGRLIAGNNVRISNDKNNFILDENGCVLNGASFTVINGKNSIVIDALNGMVFKKDNEEIIKMDINTGEAYFKGRITAESGKIGGWDISNDGFSHSNGLFYLRSNGTGRIGLMTFTNNTATFDGNIYAKNLTTGNTYFADGSYGSAGYIGDGHIEDNSISGSKLRASYKDSVTNAIAAVEVYANNTFATNLSMTQFQSNVNNQIATTRTSIEQTAAATYATINSVADFKTSTNSSISSISQKASENEANISLVVGNGKLVGTNGVTSAAIIINAINGTSSATIAADKVNLSGYVTISSLGTAGQVTINGGNISANTLNVSTITNTQISSSLGVSFPNGLSSLYFVTGNIYAAGVSAQDYGTLHLGGTGQTVNVIGTFKINGVEPNYVTSTTLSNTLSSYVTSGTLTTTLSSYATQTWVSTQLLSYSTSGHSHSNYVTTSQLSSYATQTWVNTQLSSYSTSGHSHNYASSTHKHSGTVTIGSSSYNLTIGTPT